VYFKDLPYETDSSGQTTTGLGRSGSYGRKEGRVTRKLPPEDLLGKLGIERQRKIRTDVEVAVVSVDKHRKAELVERVTMLEAAFVIAGNNKFVYY